MQSLKLLLHIPFPFTDEDRHLIEQACLSIEIEYLEGEAPEELDAVDGRDFDVVVSEWVPQDLSRWPNLKLVQLLSAGVNHIPAEHPVWDSDVRVTTASGIHSVPMAQFAICNLLMMVHQMPQLMAFGATRQWPDRTALAGYELRDKVCGVVGYGSIGREVGRQAHCLGVKVLAMKRDPQQRRDDGFQAWPGTGDADGVLPQAWFAPTQAREMVAQCDAVIVVAPATPETRDLIGEAELKAMKPSAILIVISRGGIVNEEALANALQQGQIAGAAVDSFVEEPLPSQSPLFDAPNLFLTPHMSGVYDAYWDRCLVLLCENLRRLATHQPPLNQAHGSKGY